MRTDTDMYTDMYTLVPPSDGIKNTMKVLYIQVKETDVVPTTPLWGQQKS